MTKDECLLKIESLKKVALAQIDVRTKVILNSGLIDIEKDNSYKNPILILCASLQYAASQLEPIGNTEKETLKNIHLA